MLKCGGKTRDNRLTPYKSESDKLHGGAMSKKRVRKASTDIVIGIAWRLIAFAIAAIAFRGLLSLQRWDTEYAPSAAWATETRKSHHDWSHVVAASAHGLTHEPRSKEALRAAILRQIRYAGVYQGEELGAVVAYRDLIVEQEQLRKRLEALLAPLKADFMAQSRLLTINHYDIAVRRAELAEQPTDKALRTSLNKLISTGKEIGDDLKRLEENGQKIEAGFQKQLAKVQAAVRQKEEGIATAFEATVAYARPVKFSLAWAVGEKRAIRIGNPADPLHIVHDVIWYALQALIVAIVCAMFVPWLLKLAGDDADPNATKSAVTEWVKQLLARAFGAASGHAAGKLATVATVAAIAAYGVNAAAQPPKTTSTPPAVAGERGPQGEPGRDGDSGKIPPDLLAELQAQTKALSDQRTTLEQQAEQMKAITDKVRDVARVVNATATVVGGLTANSGRLIGNYDLLLEEVQKLNGSLSQINTTVMAVASTNASFVRESMFHNHMAMRSLNSVISAVGVTNGKVDQVNTNVQNIGTKLLPNVESAFMHNALLQEDGLFDRTFRRYRLTPLTVDVVKKVIDNPEAGEARVVLCAMQTVMNDQRKPYGREELVDALVLASEKGKCEADNRQHVSAKRTAKELLDLLTPTILRVSRIPRRGV
jgi:hypothetical protein